jgi:hypothetical protein
MRIARVLRSLLLLLACANAFGADLEAKRAAIGLGEDGYVLDAEFAPSLSPRLAEVVSRGVPLYFLAEIEITRPRWYWFDQVVSAQTRTYRLSYHALTRQYRLSTGLLHQGFGELDEALRVMTRLRDWQVAERGELKAGTTYDVQVRLRLDLGQLPKPFQVSAIGNPEWNIGDEWHRFTFRPGAEAR